MVFIVNTSAVNESGEKTTQRTNERNQMTRTGVNQKKEETQQELELLVLIRNKPRKEGWQLRLKQTKFYTLGELSLTFLIL